MPGAIPRRWWGSERQRAVVRGAELSVHRPRIDGWWRKPAGGRRGSRVYIAGGDVGFLPHVVRGLNRWMVRDDLVHRHVIGDLLAAEPPVVFIRVVLQVIEAPIRRGFALSHTLMLTLSSSAVAIAALSLLFSASKCLCIKQFRCRPSVGAGGGYVGTFLAQTAQRLPKPYGGCQRFAGAVRAATSEICVLCEQRSGASGFDDAFNRRRSTRPSGSTAPSKYSRWRKCSVNSLLGGLRSA